MKITEMYKNRQTRTWDIIVVDYRKSALHHILTDINVFVNNVNENKKCQSRKDRYLHELAILYNVEDKIIYHSNILNTCRDTDVFVPFINKKNYMLDEKSGTIALKYIREYKSYNIIENYRYINNKYTPEYMLKMMNFLNCLFLNESLYRYEDFFRLDGREYSHVKYILKFINDSIEYLEYISADKEDFKFRYNKELITKRIAQLFY